MGLTYDEWAALKPDLAHLHPDASGPFSASSGPPPPTASSTAPARGRRRLVKSPDGMNKTERAYSLRLAEAVAMGRLAAWYFEPLKLRLAGRTWLKIDFLVVLPFGTMLLVDVKGHMEDDAAVKLKVCAEQFPLLLLYVVFRPKGRWEYRPVTRSGFGAWCSEPF